MPLTQDILSKKIGKKVIEDKIYEIGVDLIMMHDGSSVLAIKNFLKLQREVFNSEKVVIVFDHYCPANNIENANYHNFVREFARKNKIKLYDCGEGVCHQIMVEKGFCLPNKIIVGGDSHSTTYGALGCFSTGFGATDLAISLAYGKNWFKIPTSYKIIANEKLKKGIFAKDLILQIAKEIGVDNANYKALEFEGKTIENFTIDSRLTLCNMAVELGAKNGVVRADEKTKKFLENVFRRKNENKISNKNSLKQKKREIKMVSNKKYGIQNFSKKNKNEDNAFFKKKYENENFSKNQKTKFNQQFWKEVFSLSKKKYENSEYEKIFEIETPKEPLIACPGSIDNVKSVNEINQELTQVFIGSCTNARYEDLRTVAKILKGKKVKIRTLISPASKEIYLKALRNGLIKIFVQGNCTILPPSCSSCLGIHLGVLGNDDVCLSTSNRNFRGRMGSPNAKIYLGSPATAISSAIKGKISDCREFL